MSATMKKPDLVHEGKTWRDMPGNDSDQQRMNFAMFRRGRFKLPTPKQSEVRAKCARTDLVYAADAHELHGRLAQVRRERDLTVHAQTKLIFETTDAVSFSCLLKQLSRKCAMSEKVGQVLRKWLESQTETGSHALASAATEGGSEA
jgi:hypothetical protein